MRTSNASIGFFLVMAPELALIDIHSRAARPPQRTDPKPYSPTPVIPVPPTYTYVNP